MSDPKLISVTGKTATGTTPPARPRRIRRTSALADAMFLDLIRRDRDRVRRIVQNLNRLGASTCQTTI